MDDPNKSLEIYGPSVYYDLSMSDDELKQWFEKYRKEVSRERVISELTGKGLSPSFAERAADGHWKSKKIQRRIRSVMLEIKGNKAS